MIPLLPPAPPLSELVELLFRLTLLVRRFWSLDRVSLLAPPPMLWTGLLSEALALAISRILCAVFLSYLSEAWSDLLIRVGRTPGPIVGFPKFLRCDSPAARTAALAAAASALNLVGVLLPLEVGAPAAAAARLKFLNAFSSTD